MPHRGFSIVELLVVCLVIGVLVTIAVPQFRSVSNRAAWTEPMQIVDQLYQVAKANFDATGNDMVFSWTGDVNAIINNAANNYIAAIEIPASAYDRNNDGVADTEYQIAGNDDNSIVDDEVQARRTDTDAVIIKKRVDTGAWTTNF